MPHGISYKAASIRRLIESRNYLKETRLLIRAGLFLGIFCFAIFGILDPGLLPGQLFALYIIRYGVVIPILVTCFLLTFHGQFLKYCQLVSSIASLTASTGLIAAMSLDLSHSNFQLVYFTALVIVVGFAPSLLRMNIFFTLLTTVLAIANFNIIIEHATCTGVDIEKCQGFIAKNVLLVTSALLGCTSQVLFTILVRANRMSTVHLVRRKIAIQRSIEDINKMDKIKDKVLYILSHDLRGPIASIQGILHLFHSNNISIEELQHHSQRLSQLLQGTSGLLDNLLHWSLLTDSRAAAKKYSFVNVHHLVQENFLDFEQHANLKRTRLVNLVDAGLILPIDRALINVVIRNLVSNAVKFTESGAIVVSTRTEGRFIKLCVHDSGVGIDSYHLSRLFEWDNQLRTRGTREEVGAGLGLILCRELVEQQGGSLQVTSKKGKGTFVVVSLPFSNPDIIKSDIRFWNPSLTLKAIAMDQN